MSSIAQDFAVFFLAEAGALVKYQFQNIAAYFGWQDMTECQTGSKKNPEEVLAETW